jgi:hypothetical protein
MMSLRNLPVTPRVLFSSFLIVIGIGYLSALSYLFLVDVEPHREAGQGLVATATVRHFKWIFSDGIREFESSRPSQRVPSPLTMSRPKKLSRRSRDNRIPASLALQISHSLAGTRSDSCVPG